MAKLIDQQRDLLKDLADARGTCDPDYLPLKKLISAGYEQCIGGLQAQARAVAEAATHSGPAPLMTFACTDGAKACYPAGWACTTYAQTRSEPHSGQPPLISDSQYCRRFATLGFYANGTSVWKRPSP